ncbi:MAG: TIGR01777 family oxidoreductase [Thermoleophilaceae bacterium]
MRVAVTGATGTIGSAVVGVLQGRGDEVVAVSRDPAAAGIEAIGWDDLDLGGFDGVIHLAGEPLAQRWTDAAKSRIRDSRVDGTRRVVEALRRAEPRPRVLVSQSAEGFYPRGHALVAEDGPAGSGFLSEVVQAWEREARAAEEIGVRVAIARTGVVIARAGGALQKMLVPFKLGVGGPVAGGHQPFPWVHVDDVATALVFLLDTDAARGPVNVVAPEKHTNASFTKALGRALRRPTFMPVPAAAMKLLYGEMASTVLEGSNPDPARLLQLGFRFRHPDLEGALASEVGKKA